MQIPGSLHPNSPDIRPRVPVWRFWRFWLLGAGWLVLAVWGISVGSLPLEGWRWLMDPQSLDYQVVWQMRLPRLLLVSLAGAVLGVAGAITQALFRNPLADPGLIGVSSGAALATVMLLVWVGPTAELWLQPLAGFVGALAVAALVYWLARSGGQLSTGSLLLVGIAINSMVMAMISLLQYLSSDMTLRQVVFWMLGGFSHVGWSHVGLLFGVSLLLWVPLVKLAPQIDLLLLGASQARALGVPVFRLERLLLVLATLAVAGVISLVGMIGFIGLMVPHLMRLLVGARHPLLLPASALFGAVLLLLADLLSRVVLAPMELPVGILTSALGGPFFLYLLLWSRGRRHATG